MSILSSISNFLKKNVLDKTQLDEQLVGAVRNVFNPAPPVRLPQIRQPYIPPPTVKPIQLPNMMPQVAGQSASLTQNAKSDVENRINILKAKLSATAKPVISNIAGFAEGALTAPMDAYPDKPTEAQKSSGYSIGRSLPGLIPLAGIPAIGKIAGGVNSVLDILKTTPIWRQRSAELEKGYAKLTPQQAQIARMIDNMAIGSISQGGDLRSLGKRSKIAPLNAPIVEGEIVGQPPKLKSGKPLNEIMTVPNKPLAEIMPQKPANMPVVKPVNILSQPTTPTTKQVEGGFEGLSSIMQQPSQTGSTLLTPEQIAIKYPPSKPIIKVEGTPFKQQLINAFALQDPKNFKIEKTKIVDDTLNLLGEKRVKQIFRESGLNSANPLSITKFWAIAIPEMKAKGFAQPYWKKIWNMSDETLIKTEPPIFNKPKTTKISSILQEKPKTRTLEEMLADGKPGISQKPTNLTPTTPIKGSKVASQNLPPP